KQFFNNKLVDDVIFCNKNAKVAYVVIVYGCNRRFACDRHCHIKRNCEEEGSAFARCAFYFYNSILQVNKLFDYGQPETGTTELTGNVIACLSEAFKDFPDMLFGNPDAGIFH